MRQVIQTVKEYAEHPANWLLLRGGYGVGKTHLAAAVANKVVHSGMRVLFVVTSDLLDHLRATYQPGSPVTYDQRFNEVRRAWLLVLDDLGMQNATPWAQEKLFQILNYRYVGGLPTIITVSNSDWERLDERLQSRLTDASVCTLVDIDVPTYRGAAETRAPRRTTRQRMR
jgi:DNA replication protein DnaC